MRGGFLRTFVMLLALCAMSIRAVLPAGYMLADNEGRVVVTLCGGSAMVLELGKSEHSKQTHHDAQCPYAAAAHAAPPATEISTPSLPLAYVALETPRQLLRPGLGLAAPPPPATGPPTLS